MLAEQYEARIKADGRCVYRNGELIADVTTDPCFVGAIAKIKHYYALQESEPAVFATPEGQALSLLIPRSAEDLKRKRIAYQRVAELSHGMLGRTPDFINAALAAIAANADYLGAVTIPGSPSDQIIDLADNARSYYRQCLQHNLFVGNAAINPQLDRSQSLGQQENAYAGVRLTDVSEAGITVTGAKMIVSLAPIADELLVFNMPGLQAGDEDYALAFTLPLNSPGLKLICRKSLHYAASEKFDHPIAASFDEMDAYLILDDVFIAWPRVLVFRDVDKSNGFYQQTKARHHSGHQSIVRGLVKAELMAGVAIRLADAMGLAQYPHVQEQLGAMTASIELIKASILQCESNAEVDASGVHHPDLASIQALRYHFPKWYQSMLQTIQSLAGGSMLAVPAETDFNNTNHDCLSQALQNPVISAKARAVLLNLAWDLSGDGFGQRQLSYELNHAGVPMLLAAAHYRDADKSRLLEPVDALLRAALE